MSKKQKLSILQLEDLPDEVLLKIFSLLHIEDLISCGQLSKRIRSVCHDESLWQKMYLGWKTVPNNFLELALNNGCTYLSLSCAKLEKSVPKVNTPSKLKYLDLTGCETNKGILSLCTCLQKLSLRHLSLNNKILTKISVQNGQTLQILDLFRCTGLTLESIQIIIGNCWELKEINLCDTCLALDSVDFLVKNITDKIEKLGIGYLPIRIEQIEVLVTRCNKLTSLDLTTTSINNNCLDCVIEKLFLTLEELDVSENGRIEFFKLVELTSMPKLRVLNYRPLSNDEIKYLKKEFPHLSINENSLNIASPTQKLKPRGGFWEITAQELQIFC